LKRGGKSIGKRGLQIRITAIHVKKKSSRIEKKPNQEGGGLEVIRTLPQRGKIRTLSGAKAPIDGEKTSSKGSAAQ